MVRRSNDSVVIVVGLSGVRFSRKILTQLQGGWHHATRLAQLILSDSLKSRNAIQLENRDEEIEAWTDPD
jgi:hypothetical protein